MMRKAQDDQCGNFWCVDLLAADAGVWFYDHDFGAFARRHASLGEFGASLLAEIAEFNRRRDRVEPSDPSSRGDS